MMKRTTIAKQFRQQMLKQNLLCSAFIGLSALCMAMPTAAAQQAQGGPLVISNSPLPANLQSQVYSRPSVAPPTTPQQITGAAYFNEAGETIAGREIEELSRDLFDLQRDVNALSTRLSNLASEGQVQAANYYASVATISTQLQSGTTPGNPRLVSRLNTARENLELLSGNIALLNDLATDIAKSASVASFLLESARATYSISGAVEEDHVRLAQLEDGIANTVVIIDRLLNNVNDDITRTSAYLSTERSNLRTLALAIDTGDLFGRSLSNRSFSNVPLAGFTPAAASAAAIMPPSSMPMPMPMVDDMGNMMTPAMMPVMTPPAPRPLVKIRFDREDVSYEQPVYMAMNEALNRFPAAQFELVAVHPNSGNAAKNAIESTRSRRNAERVLRTISEMGMPLDRVNLSYAPSETATTNEVHLYVR